MTTFKEIEEALRNRKEGEEVILITENNFERIAICFIDEFLITFNRHHKATGNWKEYEIEDWSIKKIPKMQKVYTCICISPSGREYPASHFGDGFAIEEGTKILHKFINEYEVKE